MSTDRASLNSYYTAMPEMKQNGVVALADLDLTQSVSAFAELMFTSRDVTQHFSPPVVSQVLPATNPFNTTGRPLPFGTLFSKAPVHERDTRERTAP